MSLSISLNKHVCISILFSQTIHNKDAATHIEINNNSILWIEVLSLKLDYAQLKNKQSQVINVLYLELKLFYTPNIFSWCWKLHWWGSFTSCQVRGVLPGQEVTKSFAYRYTLKFTFLIEVLKKSFFFLFLKKLFWSLVWPLPSLPRCQDKCLQNCRNKHSNGFTCVQCTHFPPAAVLAELSIVWQREREHAQVFNLAKHKLLRCWGRLFHLWHVLAMQAGEGYFL